MTPAWNIVEDILKNQKPIDEQIRSAEKELVALDEKRKALQARIKRLKEQNNQLPKSSFLLIGYLSHDANGSYLT
jgi:cell division protein FtsB